MRTKHLRNLLSASAALLFAIQVNAHDHINLERGIPVQLEDAYPTAFQNREFQGIAKYERTDDDENRYELVPVLEYGIFRNSELEIEVPVKFEPGPNEGSGNIETAFLYNLNYEGLLLPAISPIVRAVIPTGKNSRGLDTSLGLALTKTLSRTGFFHRIHANAFWHHNEDPSFDERSNRYEFALGYQARLDNSNQLLFNVLRKQEVKRDKASNLVELGLRHQWNPLWVLAVGATVGIGSGSPNFMGTLGFQRMINWPYGGP
ncbi:MAG: hypothetical protein A2428_10175 [Bdellovibrionales bacterium RIFOXYC1_FULL_54_43]|nr:MAG: hypothetical protein A2428_10175 [Bdellovibrionales bacterium RIFOXYC1_FULL_54_43]OFZ80514.1 MAG: hypothetical protein A2603_13080 [Bdellovibrionales bacterium RIFOXYD1_FULL_55_31]